MKRVLLVYPGYIVRETVIDFVYSLKRLLPNSDFFMKTR